MEIQLRILNGSVVDYRETIQGESGAILPQSITVSGAYLMSYSSETGEFSLANLTSSVTITASATADFTITKNATHCTATGNSFINVGETATVTFTADSGYTLPKNITVTGADYTYDYDTGVVTLSNPVSNVVITVIATSLMSMVLYQNTSEQIRIGKTLTEVGTLVGALRNECPISSPVIIVEQETLPSFNYAYISIFQRYYFVTEIKSVRMGLWEIYFDCDVLETYRDGILALSCLVSRSQSDYNTKIPDNRRIQKTSTTVEIINGTIPSTIPLWYNPQVMDVTTEGNGTIFTPYKLRYILTVASESAAGTTITPPNGSVPLWTTFQSNYKYALNETFVFDFFKQILGITPATLSFLLTGDLSNAIISLKAYPFNFYALNGNTWGRWSNDIKIGSVNMNMPTPVPVFDEFATEKNEIEMLRFYINPANFDWIDYEATYSFYLPFYGFVNIPIDEIVSKFMSIRYVIDFNTGMCLAKIGHSTNQSYDDFTELFRYNFNIGIDIPISASNSHEVLRGILQAGSLLIGAATFGVSTALAMPEVAAASGAPMLTEGSQLATLAQPTNASFFDYQSGYIPTPEVIQKPYGYIRKRDVANNLAHTSEKMVRHIYRGNNGGNPAYDIRSSTRPFIVKMKPDYIEDTHFVEQNGYPCYITKTLSSLYGYTECANVKVKGNGFATATQPECAEIKRLLESGVILPQST